MIHSDLEVLNIPAFTLGIHSNRHRGARCERGAQQVERIGSEIFSAETLWFSTTKGPPTLPTNSTLLATGCLPTHHQEGSAAGWVEEKPREVARG